MSARAWAASPYSLSYGGRLADANGAPMTGAVELTIKFFDAASGGNQLGPAVDDQNVALTGGVFQAPVVLDGPAFAQIFGTSSQVFIEVTDVTHSKTYPRQSFAAVPYALRVPVDSATITYDGNGNLTLVSPDKVSSAGGSMSGSLSMTGGATVTGLPSPVNPGDAVNKSYADSISSTLAGEINGKVSSQWTTSGSAISYSGGSVGVGTTSPGATLEVDGSVKIVDGSQALGKVLTSDANGLASWQTVSGSSQWTTNGSNIYFGAGNVGIGTTSPGYALDAPGSARTGSLTVQPVGASSLLKVATDSTSWVSPSIQLYEGHTGDTWYLNLDYGDPALKIVSGAGGERLRIDGNGNVGIGSTSPTTLLDVAGTFRMHDGTEGANKVLTSDANGDATWQTPTAAPVTNNANNGLDNVAQLSIGTTATSGADLLFGAAGRTIAVADQAAVGGNLTIQAGASTVTGDNGGNLTLASGATSGGTASSQIQLQTSNNGVTVNALTVLGNGNVGIGTTTPARNLDIVSPSLGCGGSEDVAAFAASGANPLRIITGNDCNGESKQQIYAYTDGNNPASSILTLTTWDNNWVDTSDEMPALLLQAGTASASKNYAARQLVGIANGSGAVLDVFGATGSLGIGTISPAGLLDVEGSGGVVINAGNVGIGTTSPTGTLDVEGGTAAQMSAGSSITVHAQSANGGNLYGGNINLEPGQGTGGYGDTGAVNIFSATYAGDLGELTLHKYEGYGAPATIQSGDHLGSDPLVLNPSGGDVGIGTTSSGAKLEVNGGITLSSGSAGVITFADGTTQATAAAGASANWGGGALDNVASLSIGTAASGTDLYFGSGNRTESVQSVTSGAGGSLSIQAGGTSGSDQSGGNLVLASGASNGAGSSEIQLQTYNGGTPTNALTILGNGNVGIGTTAPSNLLDVASDVNDLTEARVYNPNPGTSASASLAVEGVSLHGLALSYFPSNFGFLGLLGVPGDSAVLAANSPTVGGLVLGALNSSAPIVFGTGGAPMTERMRITSSGNVGIGSTSPQAALDVGSGNVKMGYTTVGLTEIVASIAADTWSSYVSICTGNGFVIGASCWIGSGSSTSVPWQANSSGQVAAYNSGGAGNSLWCTAVCANMR